MSTSLGDRIKMKRTQLNLTQEELGQKIGVQKSAIAKYESGRVENLKRSIIYNLAKALETTPAYLMGWEDDDVKLSSFKNAEILMNVKKKKMPLLGSTACGTGVINFDDLEETDYIDTDEDIKADFALKCVGDSMINARIDDGDLVFIDRKVNVKNGDIAAVSIDNEIMLKRVYINGKTMTLVSENSKYPPKVFRLHEENQIEVQILGKAVAFQSYL